MDVLGDMASDDEGNANRRSNRGLVNRRAGAPQQARNSRNPNGLNGMDSATVENNSVSVAINVKNNLQHQVQEEPKIGKQGEASSVACKVCRICLGEDDDSDNPLIEPCKCAGSMSSIHIECLRTWLNSKRSFKEN